MAAATMLARTLVFFTMRIVSAKHSRKSANKPTPARPAAAPIASEPAGVTVAGSGAAVASAEPTSWLDSSDPRKRLWGKIIFAGIWIYVGALWLLALDQTFNWGIFGPKVPPLP
jgi:hypothetical protein